MVLPLLLPNMLFFCCMQGWVTLMVGTAPTCLRMVAPCSGMRILASPVLLL
eukprot:CAMPEP_0173351608 /NCGR_PEP_ID=MMETSP1144-20121109/15552_1 /TAXON_ID=483371 /ORGANISM="non described non described, Strain CCMP2298" /LENGTH=50 /DNA_ID=CAMNT_0014299721 /DNA_START=65 /DNA_END=214 /DNA_ORIENTATION=-